MKHASLSAALIAALLFSGCARYATVSERRPVFQPVRRTIGALVAAEQAIEEGLRRERRAPEEALGTYLAAADEASRQLAKQPADTVARDAYNFAVARAIGAIDAIAEGGIDPWSRPLRVPSPGGDYFLTRKPDPRKGWNPAFYRLTPADEFEVGGTYVERREIKEGVGAPVVALAKKPNENFTAEFVPRRTIYGVTALIRFEGRKAVVSFEDPMATEEVSLGGRRFPMAADYTVPLAVMLASSDPKELEVNRLLNPERYQQTTLLSKLQPYDPEKTVVLLVHGLMDSQATWAPMVNRLRADPEIRRNFQIWFFSYPSGYPYPHSAALLRQHLDAMKRRYPLAKKIVVIGHSMGGCISRLLITDTGDRLWMKLAGKPRDQLSLSPDTEKLLADAIEFRHRSEVGRVIFISAPLRGSEIASNPLGRIGSSLVKTPSHLARAGNEVLSVAAFRPGDLKLKRLPDSIDTLAPNNRFVKAINTIPVTPGIPHHVICGDRGKGGNKDRTKPVMSDGVVPYWSSHMETARSERIVPSGHPAHQNPEAIGEVMRILKEHARTAD